MNGIRPSEIPYVFHPVEDHEWEESLADTVPNQAERFLAHPAGQEALRHWWGEMPTPEAKADVRARWDDRWRQFPGEALMQVFTCEECFRIWHASVIMSDLSEYIEKEHPLIEKICVTHWHYDWGRSWNLLVKHLDALKRLDFDLGPDFETRLVWTNKYNTQGPCEQDFKLFLDASFGLLLYYKGEHVLTVGFGLCDRGVLIAQVQLRQKQGNRFLFKLPGHYLDLVLDTFHRAFIGEDPWLVDGASAVTAVRLSYGKNVPDTLTSEVTDRIAQLYDRPLRGFQRLLETCNFTRRTFIKVVPCAVQEVAA